MERYDPGLTVIADAQKARDSGSKQEAYDKYLEGIEKLFQAVSDEKNEDTAKMVRKHIAKFMDEAEAVKNDLSKPDPRSVPLQHAQTAERKATESEKAYKFALALHQYKQAAEHYMAYQKEVEGNEILVKWARERVLWTITKAEAFQRLTKKPEPQQNLDAMLFDLPSVPTSPKAGQPGSTGSADSMEVGGRIPPMETSEPGKLPNSLAAAFVRGRLEGSAEEQKVLIRGSRINGKTFEPMYQGDAEERSFLGDTWTDPEGFPKLSEKQKKQGAVWGRPSQFMHKPEIVKNFTYHSIVQSEVGECAFAASLAACAAWERRFGKSLISRNIYPQKNGIPAVSPNGRYIVKLFLNGTVRKVVIDDLLPVSPSSPPELLSAASSSGDELWVPLFEKAYVKVFGGYAYGGANSSIDVHALCGWIPETFKLRAPPPMLTASGSGTAVSPETPTGTVTAAAVVDEEGTGATVIATAIEEVKPEARDTPQDAQDKDKDKDALDAEQVWSRMVQGHNKGTALFTMATRPLSPDVTEQIGLSDKHAYAVLEVREVLGRRIVRLKTPWAHLRWKGDFSKADEFNWTPELKSCLGYDQEAEKDEEESGVFWISWESVCTYFASVFASWSPARFSIRKNVHYQWVKTHADDKHFDDNPQFVLRVTAKQRTMVWLLLHRHVTSSDNQPSISLHVGRGNRRLYQNTPKTFTIRSAFRSAPHCLVKLPVEKGNQSFVLVASMREETGTLPFTISAYSADPAALYTAVDCPRLEGGEAKCATKTFKYRWDEKSAGGNPNKADFEKNPMFRLEVSELQRVFVKLVVSHTAYKSSVVRKAGTEETPEGPTVARKLEADPAPTEDEAKQSEEESGKEKAKAEDKGEGEKKKEGEDGDGKKGKEEKEEGGGEEKKEKGTEEGEEKK
mmetsp:Transcript_37047/g.87517  ORF Transcript_37047/g.87517 Transcript_37047/m.87517 type:complete len:906 (+) Transcript_37047:104-2821(+)